MPASLVEPAHRLEERDATQARWDRYSMSHVEPAWRPEERDGISFDGRDALRSAIL
ncbi:MAG TPA: hypothetical protein VFS66_02640 [Acidimicrobiia bacterium]|nr:hypothetical protein [Acidimicrobiia bacterium]